MKHWLRRAPSASPPAAPDIRQTMLQLRLAEAIGWIVDRADVVGDSFEMAGWALSPTTRLSALRFLLNGEPFAEVDWPLPSPDVAAYFPQLPYAAQCRFICRQKLSAPDRPFPDGYARLSCVPPHGANGRGYRKSVYMLNPALEPPIPDHARIVRVIAGDATSYRLGGASLAKRIDAYLADRFSRPLASFAAVLDWGCGAGRVTRQLIRLCDGRVTGIDIDPDNVGWCAAAFPGATFAVGPLQPPLPYPDASFDLVLAISVFTHLDEATQFRWLAELRRVVRSGGIVLASIHGMAQMAFYKVPSQHVLDVNERGFLLSGQNDQLDAVIDDKKYYKNVTQSHDYIYEQWSEYFAVCDIVEGIAANQDLVAMLRT
jgi:SAM-dependent methyltransferase